MMNTKMDGEWIRCGKCGHKLGRLAGAGYCDPSPIIEIKCHSCKEVNIWFYKQQDGKMVGKGLEGYLK